MYLPPVTEDHATKFLKKASRLIITLKFQIETNKKSWIYTQTKHKNKKTVSLKNSSTNPAPSSDESSDEEEFQPSQM